MPYDGKPEHDPPYTPLGLQTLKSHKALFGYAAVLEGFSNDPRNKCDPLGFPRADFYQIRHTQIMQNERQVVILYEFEKKMAHHLDGRAGPSEGNSGAKVVRIFRGQLGGRQHACGPDSRDYGG